MTPGGGNQIMDEARVEAAQALADAEIEQALTAGKHYWVVTVAYAITGALPMVGTPTPDLTADNFRMIGVGCYLCEEPWSTRIALRPCPAGR